MSLDVLALIVSGLSILVSGGTALWAVSIQRKDSANDQKRFLRESILFLNETLLAPSFMEARRRFFDSSNAQYSEMTNEVKNDARLILSRYGVIGRMIRHGALSKEMFLDYWETTFQRDWNRLKPFVTAERIAKKKPKLFDATEDLAKQCGVSAMKLDQPSEQVHCPEEEEGKTT